MGIKFIIPEEKETFGTLKFAGEGEVRTKKVKGKIMTDEREYYLYSSVQKADNVFVILPGSAGEKKFEYEDTVKLVNPRIIPEGYKIGTQGFVKYKIYADDLLKA